jgi:hypothetical protein
LAFPAGSSVTWPASRALFVMHGAAATSVDGPDGRSSIQVVASDLAGNFSVPTSVDVDIPDGSS